MKKSYLNISSIISSLVDLPSPMNLSYMWNLGSLLGILMVFQILTGVFLVFHYTCSENEAFDSIVCLMREVKFGFLFRFLHLNGASFVFTIMYLHMSKGLLNNSFLLTGSWLTGNMILLLTILVAFMGYVLPWGNMGFWAATVITSFISAIPLIGESLMNWIWGGFSVSGRTLQFFFTLHYIMPFIIMGVSIVHLILLHNSGSSNPLGSHSAIFKVKFFPYSSSMDMLNIIIVLLAVLFVLINPYWSSDPENFSYADRLSSPINIQPEWYFLPFYALLRSSSNKLGGLILMLLGVFMFWILPNFMYQDLKNFFMYNMSLMVFSLITLILGWVASWSADSYFSIWLPFLVIGFFSWWFFVWLFSLLMHSIFY